MNEELGYEVTPKQSLDGLWKTMYKYIEHHGYSDISLELEGSQYEFRQHLQKYDEYEAKNKELLEELKYLRKVNNDLVWQRDTDEEHEAKAKAYNDTLKTLDKLINDDERYKEARSNDFIAGMLIAYENIFNLMEDYIKEGCE